MPLLKPKPAESKEYFVSRCMANDIMNSQYKDEKQRAAICYSFYDEERLTEIREMLSGLQKDEYIPLEQRKKK
jgi:hypothetical protein